MSQSVSLPGRVVVLIVGKPLRTIDMAFNKNRDQQIGTHATSAAEGNLCI